MVKGGSPIVTGVALIIHKASAKDSTREWVGLDGFYTIEQGPALALATLHFRVILQHRGRVLYRARTSSRFTHRFNSKQVFSLVLWLTINRPTPIQDRQA